jgi:hypothetical protein
MSSAASGPKSSPPPRPDVEELRARGLAALRRVQESGAFDDLTDEAIQAEIDAYREERRRVEAEPKKSDEPQRRAG